MPYPLPGAPQTPIVNDLGYAFAILCSLAGHGPAISQCYFYCFIVYWHITCMSIPFWLVPLIPNFKATKICQKQFLKILFGALLYSQNFPQYNEQGVYLQNKLHTFRWIGKWWKYVIISIVEDSDDDLIGPKLSDMGSLVSIFLYTSYLIVVVQCQHVKMQGIKYPCTSRQWNHHNWQLWLFHLDWIADNRLTAQHCFVSKTFARKLI